MAMFFVSEVLFKSPLGALADKFGRKPLMLGGAAVTVFTPVLLISMHYNPASATAAAALIGFGFLRGMDGLGEAALWPSLYAYVGDVVVEARRGAAMGVLNLVYMVGIAFSFLAGGFVDDTFGPVLTHQRTLGTRCSGGGAARAIRSETRATSSKTRCTARTTCRRCTHALPRLPRPRRRRRPVVPPVFQPEYYFPSFYLTSVLFAVAVVAGAVPARQGAHPARRRRTTCRTRASPGRDSWPPCAWPRSTCCWRSSCSPASAASHCWSRNSPWTNSGSRRRPSASWCWGRRW